MTDDSTDTVVAQLRTRGYPQATWLSSGMEADVFALDADTVGRLPKDAAASTSTPLEHFVQQLADAGLPFQVPASLGTVDLADGRAVVRQPRLLGRSIGTFYDEASGHLDSRAEKALVDLLAALHAVPTQRPALLSDLPLLGRADTSTGAGWPAAVRTLLAEQARSHRAVLSHHVEELDALVRSCDDFLAGRASVELAVQHGDICRENVLVDDDGTLNAVLDWGWLTMLADPVFEMALTAGFFDMYGPHALQTDHRLTDLFVDVFTVQRDDLLRYKAVYALLGANAYSRTADGHFLWCVAVLHRPDVRAAVLG